MHPPVGAHLAATSSLGEFFSDQAHSVSMDEGRERKEMKTQMTNVRSRDRLSELSDCVLLHILNFMETIYAVRTCILSKRWKVLWKRLTTLTFDAWSFKSVANYNKFVSQVLSNRDGCISLFKLTFWSLCSTQSETLNSATRYAALHNVQQLTIDVTSKFINKPNCFDPLIFTCPSLTILKLHKSFSVPHLELPTSLQLPALKSLFLANVCFTATNNGCTEPFSACIMLNTLVLEKCSLHEDAEVLTISNSNLSTLELDSFQHKIVLSTPNLSSLKITNYLGFRYQPLSSTCNLSCLEEGFIYTNPNISYQVFIGWLQLFTNVKILTFSYNTLRLLKDPSNHATMRTQPPCFVRLETLKVLKYSHVAISDEEFNRVMKYLLENSPMTRASLINA